MAGRPLAWGLTVAGGATQTVGLAADAWMHASDETLAAREGLFSQAHIVMLAGMTMVAAGVALLVLRWLRAPGRTRVAVAGGIACLVLLGASGAGAAVAAARGGATAPHTHAGTPPAASDPFGFVQRVRTVESVEAGASEEHGHGHEASGSEPLDRATRDELAGQLVVAREVALRHPTVADADRAGYRKVSEYIPLVAAHYMHFGLVDGEFDVTQPEMLLYDGTEPDARIVGLSYYVRATSEPGGFAGPHDRWHRHIGLCIDPRRTLVIGDEQTTEGECRRRGGVKADGSDGWMVHAWVVPGWESPEGVFSAENPMLR